MTRTVDRMGDVTRPELIDLDVGALGPYLIANEAAVRGELRWEPIEGVRSNVTYRVADDEPAWALRCPPVAGLTPSADDRELIRVLVDLHAVPYREVGLAELGRPDGFAARQVRRWRHQWGLIASSSSILGAR
jgi:aminoglycoside phosphotransferase (APT) family kinase protein